MSEADAVKIIKYYTLKVKVMNERAGIVLPKRKYVVRGLEDDSEEEGEKTGAEDGEEKEGGEGKEGKGERVKNESEGGGGERSARGVVLSLAERLKKQT